ncbi:MAG TPA: hypothetical protein VGL71_08475 [Urbifossiella sp.]
MLSLLLFAQKKPAGSPFDRSEMIWGSVGLAGSLLVGAIAIYLVDRWRKRSNLAAEREAGLELTDFRAMFESGEITEAEYNKLRLKVADRVKKPAPGAASSGETAGNPPALPVAGPFPPGYFDDPLTSPPRNSPPPEAPGGTVPSA